MSSPEPRAAWAVRARRLAADGWAVESFCGDATGEADVASLVATVEAGEPGPERVSVDLVQPGRMPVERHVLRAGADPRAGGQNGRLRWRDA